jgi:hypothetical protein
MPLSDNSIVVHAAKRQKPCPASSFQNAEQGSCRFDSLLSLIRYNLLIRVLKNLIQDAVTASVSMPPLALQLLPIRLSPHLLASKGNL